jgi:hypothetical protein
MWVKISKKKTLLEAFEEAILVQKYMLSLKDNKNPKTIQASSSNKKFDTLPKLPSAKKDQEPLDAGAPTLPIFKF